MRDAVALMSKIREQPSLARRAELFRGYLRDEFGYVGFTYGIALDGSSFDSMLGSFLKTDYGRPQEWVRQYQQEGLGRRDLAVAFVFLRSGVLLQSRVFQAIADGAVPEPYHEVPLRGREVSPSGFFLSLRSGGLVAGMGLHSTLSEERHDAQFAKVGHLIVELCRQFHDMASWRPDVVDKLGLTERNLEVLQLRSEGLQDKQIIERTGHRHENSVRQHMERIQAALNTRNERQTLIRAASLGLTAIQDAPDQKLRELEKTARLAAQREGWLWDL